MNALRQSCAAASPARAAHCLPRVAAASLGAAASKPRSTAALATQFGSSTRRAFQAARSSTPTSLQTRVRFPLPQASALSHTGRQCSREALTCWFRSYMAPHECRAIEDQLGLAPPLRWRLPAQVAAEWHLQDAVVGDLAFIRPFTAVALVRVLPPLSGRRTREIQGD